MRMKTNNKRGVLWILLTAFLLVVLGSFSFLLLSYRTGQTQAESTGPSASAYSVCRLEDIPDYQGKAFVEIEGNKPSFSEKELSQKAFEHYSNLDSLGRCGTACANVCPETMPKDERESISEVHPSGWQVSNYPDLIEDDSLYNRCHLIAFSLAGENANEKNLITGTRYMNTEGMQPFELEILEYIRSTGNHVLYRVTPIFNGDDLVAAGVEMEAMSVEDQGRGISFHVFAYNVQPGVVIDYKTGDNKRDLNSSKAEADTERTDQNPDDDGRDTNGQEEAADNSRDKDEQKEAADDSRDTEGQKESAGGYVLNKNTHKFHNPSCPSVSDIKDKNKLHSEESREKIIEEGYEPCGQCRP